MREALQGKHILRDSRDIYRTIKASPEQKIKYRILYGLLNHSPSSLTEHCLLLEKTGLVESYIDVAGDLVLRIKKY